jgi:RNA polymerase sigma factor (sigma-70 family)
MTQLNGDFWEQAYKNHYKPLCSRARRRLTDGDADEAEDVISEAFMRAMRYVRLPEVIVNLRGYLWTTAKHVLFAKRARENTKHMDSLDQMRESGFDIAVEPEVFRVLDNEEYRDTMSVRLGPLNDREKQLLVLHLQGYTCDEIAATMGEDVRVTRSDLNGVRAKVRYRLSRAKVKGSGR